MLIQKDIEAKVIAALKAKIGDDCPPVEGSWEASMSGLVKWVESTDDADAAFISVSTSCPSWEVASTPLVNFSINISLFIRTELDATGVLLNSIAEDIEDLLRGWMLANEAAPLTALDTTDFSCGGIQTNGGSSPTIKDGNAVVSWGFTLSGSYNPTNA